MGENLDKVKGTIKEETGRATGDEELTREGQVDQAKGDVKQGVDDAGDAIKRGLDRATDRS
ncbi:MAG: CsbD-like [Gaiellales bacterium]|jgi:uncharacterized protein YjbJ (UPF0337 family)|nr:CsbD-like [Gaiellales bacterium]